MGDDLLELGRDSDLYELLPDNISSNALANAIVVAGAHKFFGFTVNNTKASVQYILVFDAAVLPADGAVPAVSFTAPASSDKGVVWIPARKMLGGIVICNSSTADTKTIGSSDCLFDVQYA